MLLTRVLRTPWTALARSPLGTVVAMTFFLLISLLPLAALLLMLPAFLPEETVLTDSNQRSRTPWADLLKRLIMFLLGLVLLETIIVFSIELVSWMPLGSTPDLTASLWGILPASLVEQFPVALRDHPAYCLLTIYLIDLGLLTIIGKVPLRYNVRNLLVRWRITMITALAFVVVVTLLTVMLAFVNGMYQLTESSGKPGNVFVLSEGSTDEFFSDLGYGDITKLIDERVDFDRFDQPLAIPITVGKGTVNGKQVDLFSQETYFTVNEAVPNGNGKRRFVQLRGIRDPEIAGLVHGIELKPGGEWFTPVGARKSADGPQVLYECVLGEGVAATFGGDVGKKSLEPGDTFRLGDETWLVMGIMKTEGTTFGSEVWGAQSLLGNKFRKNTTTTVVLRVEPDNAENAADFAYHLNNRYQYQKLRAVPETVYYANLSSTNRQFLVAIVFVAVIMAVGGIFGVMNTMFAAIAQRTKDIGVMRILGYKRWQVLVSFMLESLGIALLGGLLGIIISGVACWLYAALGFQVNSIVSSGQGGGKTVVLKLIASPDILAAGLLFAIIMGRLGGLVPSLSAMRLRILESLR